MKAVSMSGYHRDNVGKKDAKKIRKEGKVPCVIYGCKQEQMHIYLDEKSFKNLIYTPETNYAEININGTIYKAVIKEAQFHKLTDKLLHADFLIINDQKPITVAIPLTISGNSPGVMRGGKLTKKFRKIKVKGIYSNIPDVLTIDISNLDINDAILVKDVNIENIEIMENPSNVIVSVLSTRNVEAVVAE